MYSMNETKSDMMAMCLRGLLRNENVLRKNIYMI